MSRRVVVERAAAGSVPADDGEVLRIETPALAAIRLVFGVGSEPDLEPTPADFIPVYTVGIPIVSPGGLDPDGVYEFDAGAQLELLRGRATRRRWAVRLELEFVQSADSVAAADVWFEVDWTGDEQSLISLGSQPTLAGGGRAITVASLPVTDIADAARLGGRFCVCARDSDPRSTGARVESPLGVVEIDTSHYEHEPERRPRAG